MKFRWEKIVMEKLEGEVIFKERNKELGIDKCWSRMDSELGLMKEKGVFVRNDRVGDILEIGIREKSYGMGMGWEIRVNLMNKGGRMSGEMWMSVRIKVDLDWVEVELKDEEWIGNDDEEGKSRN